MNSLKGIIFDVDGTLADTEDTHRQAFNLAFQEFELDWDWTPSLYEELLAISGGKERIKYYGADLAENFSTTEEFSHYVRELHTVKTSIYGELLSSGAVRLRDGVRRLIDEARRHNLILAIATSSTYSNLKTLLDQNIDEDWASWFTTIKTCDTVEAKKPSPAVYQAVLNELPIGASSCVAIEDTENGLTAATSAGVATIVTTHFFTRHHHFPTATLVLDRLGEPDQPFRVFAGDAGEATYVDVELLNRQLESNQVEQRHSDTAETTHTATA